MKQRLKRWYLHWRDPDLLKQSIYTSVIVGTVLLVINQPDLIRFHWDFTYYWKIPLTYLVPYGVASFAGTQSLIKRKSGQEINEAGRYRCELCWEHGYKSELTVNSGAVMPNCEQHGSDGQFVLIEAKPDT